MSKDYDFGIKFEQNKHNAELTEQKFREITKIEKDILLPKKRIRSAKEFMTLYDGLIKRCLYFELRRESIEGSIARMKEWTKKTVPLIKEFNIAARMQLEEINTLLEFDRGRLDAVKEEIRRIYNTNEYFINVFAQSAGIEKKEIIALEKKHQNAHPDLLHGGGVGWMNEYEGYLKMRKEWDIVLLTFGTYYDPAKIDIMVFNVQFKIRGKKKVFPSFKKPKR